ncbi:MAG TPA: hypothetical protein VGL59_18910 [Polyangia bacterium]
MIARAARRLPGIGFESRSSQRPDELPRMDVAAFVGFAAAGPLNTPVPVEDAAAFADLFGVDPTLAWDRERSEFVRGNLGPAVRSFFLNDGRRAFVVRVAGDSAASNHFPVPGLVRMTPNGLRPAFLAARSQGSWSDSYDVAAVTSEQAAAVQAVTFADGQLQSVQLSSPDTVAVGDLLRLRWDDGTMLLAPVAGLDGALATVMEGAGLWLLPAPAVSAGAWTADFFPRHDQGPQSLPPVIADPTFADDGTAIVTLSGDAVIDAGHLVRLSRDNDQLWLLVTTIQSVPTTGSPPGQGTALGGRWSRPTTAAPAGAPVGLPGCDRVRIELWVRDGGVRPERLDDIGLGPGHPRYLGALPDDARLFASDDDLLTDGERALRDRVRTMIGDGTDLRSYHSDLWQAVANPRFPLAADEGQTDLYFPLGMGIVPDVYRQPEPIAGDAATRDGLQVFSAALFVDPALADETVRSLQEQADHIRWQQPQPRRLTGMHALLAVDEATLVAAPDAAQRGWSTETVAPPAPLDAPVLTARADAAGLWHLGWNAGDPDASFVLESSLDATFAAPTAITLSPAIITYDVPAPAPAAIWFRVRAYLPSPQSSSADYFAPAETAEAAGSFWSDPVRLESPLPAFVACPAGALGTPTLSLAAPPDGNGSFRLTWSAVVGALRYVVEESDALDFLDDKVVYAGPGQDVTLYGRADGRYHYRVHAEGTVATMSPVIVIGSDGALFDVSDVDSPQHLVLATYEGAIGDETVFDGDAFTERFAASSTRVAVGDLYRYNLLRDDGWPGAPAFRAFSPDTAGAPSNGVAVTVAPPPRLVQWPAATYDPAGRQILLTIQAALVRMAAARGDLFAVLSLPETDRAGDAAAHVTALRAAIPEDAAWSYGALYHPWLLLESPDGDPLRRAPADGAVLGVMAARAIARGAWIAPANQPIGDALGLSPAIPREQRQRLYEAQVNVIRQEAHGFVAMSADTLSLDPDLTPINVRRLLTLIRRLALREGPGFVFEPNSGVFRRAVERQFEGLLGGMFRAGAFAGATAETSFQVAVDSSVNTPDSLDQGRFIVELKVAPSLPLSFLTVRLLQSGGLGQVTEGG